MAKVLNGRDLADYMKARQAQQVRSLKQGRGIFPKLVILRDSRNPVIDVYVRMKKAYGADIGVIVEDRLVATEELEGEVEKLNQDGSVHGMIVQLPLADAEMVDKVVDKVVAEKDVDGLGLGRVFDSATAMAVNYLLAGYGVELRGKEVAIVGYGRLVGRPLAQMWEDSGLKVRVFRSKDAENLAEELVKFDVIVAATGKARLITSEMVKKGAVVVDAGTASEKGVILGDVDDAVREREDVVITPKIGGVGPLTIAALFENVIRAAGY